MKQNRQRLSESRRERDGKRTIKFGSSETSTGEGILGIMVGFQLVFWLILPKPGAT